MNFKIIRFIFFALFTFSFVYLLNTKNGEIPALGKLLNPFSGFWQNGENEAITIPDEIKNNFLNENATVVFDDLSIPHIYAKNDHDAFFLQGYITASHRLWQMDFSARATAGRLSEVLGKVTITYDRTQRRKGLVFAAERLLEEIKKDPASYKMLEAYSEGVNAYINSISYKNYGVEYKLLNIEPEQWTPLKSCIMMKSMADMLSRSESDLENTNALKMFGKKTFDQIFPEFPSNIDPIIPSGTPYNFQPLKSAASLLPMKDSTYLNIPTSKTIEKPNPFNGSNSLAVGPSKTKNGEVILTNEPDLNLTLPSIWYIVHLNTDQLNVMGSTVPGMPGVLIGFNDKIAWGNTNAPRDLVDWYQVSYKNNKRDEYRYDDKWLKAHKRIEKIEIAGESTLYDTVIYTHFGPVTYDNQFLGNEQKINYAMRWTGHDPSAEYKTVYQINRAKNYDQFVNSFDHFTGPPQNYSYGDVEGNIALWINGKFPIKWNEQGKFLLDGSKSNHEWQGFIPTEQNLHIKNPERGFVSSANQHPADSTYPYYSFHHNNEFYRGRRLNDRLGTMTNVTVRDLQKLQNDNFNYIASENLSLLLDSLDSGSFNNSKLTYYQMLRNWDYFNDPELIEPSVFELWQDRFISLLWDEFRQENVSLRTPNEFYTFNYIKQNRSSSFYDNKNTEKKESLRDLINASFTYAVDSVDSWEQKNNEKAKWYLFKNTTIRHILRLKPFSRDKIKIGGNNHIVNAASKYHGPSWRMVVSLSDKGVSAWGTYPGSQTGNVGNPNYAHWIEEWAQGKYTKLLFDKEKNLPKDRILKTIKFEKE